jgi:hypothetical protein
MHGEEQRVDLITTGSLGLAAWEDPHHHHQKPEDIAAVPATLFRTNELFDVSITVVAAKYLRSVDLRSLSNPLCEVLLGGGLLHTTRLTPCLPLAQQLPPT